MRITTTLVVCFIALAAFGMILPAGATTSVSIGSATSSTCDTVSITIDTDETEGIGIATLTVGYDSSKVSLSSVSNGAIGDVTHSDISGIITLYAASATACPTGNDIAFADLEFCPVAGASGCSDLDLEVTTLADCIGTSITPDSVNDGTFCMGASNADPTVTVTYPTSGTVSGTIDVTATATDSDGSVTQVAFYLMPGGSSIGTDADGNGGWSVSLDTTTVTDGDYQVKAVATDNEGATGDDTGGVFAIDNACPCDFCLDLEAGLNLVSIPKTVEGSNDAKTVFDIDPYAGEFCIYYDAGSGCYDYAPTVKQCLGYWVYKNAATTICIDFDDGVMPPSQQLYEGWNMIGHVDTEEMPIYEEGNDADFGSVTGLEDPEDTKLFRQVNTYTQDAGWTNYPTGGLTQMTPGVGYWILMKEGVMMYGIP